MSDQNKDDADTLSALMAAAQQKADAAIAAAQTKYNDARAEAATMVDKAKESFNQGMQTANQLADAAKTKFNEGMEAAQQLASDTKAKFEAGVQAAQGYAADAKATMEKGIADAKQQGMSMMEAAKERVRNPGESDKAAMVEAGKQGAELAGQALGQGGHMMAGMPGSQDVAKAWQHFQDGGGVPVAKMLAEQKLADMGVHSTDAINKMADASKTPQDNDFNRMNQASEQDLKAKYLARAKDIGEDKSKAETQWNSANPKPPENQPAAPKPAATPTPTPSPSPQPKL